MEVLPRPAVRFSSMVFREGMGETVQSDRRERAVRPYPCGAEEQPGDGAVSLLLVGDPPDGIISILAHEECAVFRDGKSHGSAPNISFGRQETSQKILVNPRRLTAVERDAHHLVPRSFGSVS